MSRTVLSAQGTRIAIMASALVIILAGVRAASEIIVPFLLALFLAIILNPLVKILMKLRLPRSAAVGLVGHHYSRFDANDWHVGSIAE